MFITFYQWVFGAGLCAAVLRENDANKDCIVRKALLYLRTQPRIAGSK